jgi:hypothetical protein
MEILRSEDFAHTVSLPTPHGLKAARSWLDERNINYTFSTHNIFRDSKPTIEYNFLNERDATLFALKWS